MIKIKIGEKQFNTGYEEDTTYIHTPFIPVEVRQEDGIHGEIVLTVEGTKLPARTIRIWTMSPLGIEFVCDDFDGIKLDSEVDLKLTVQGQVCELHGLLVTNIAHQKGTRRFGIRWCAKSGTIPETDRRSGTRWLCGNEFLPTGMATSPIKPGDFVLFRVKDMSNQGMQILTSLRNKLLIPGMKLSSNITFPLWGTIQVELQIVTTKVIMEGDKEFLSLGTKILNADEDVREIMGQYILQFGPPTSVQELKRQNFPVRSVVHSLEFSFVRTAEEYREVLELRKRCYALAKKVSAEVTPEELSDVFDTRSRIMMVRYRGELIGTARLTYPDANTPVEHEQFVTFPADFPKREEMVDISRFCTHPHYRGSDLLLAMFREICRTVVQSRRRYLIGSSTPKLLPIYERIGMRPTKLSYQHESLGGSDHILFMADSHAVMAGKQINPLVWNALYSDLSSSFTVREVLKFSAAVHARLALLRLLKPISKLLFEKRLRQPRRVSKKASEKES